MQRCSVFSAINSLYTTTNRLARPICREKDRRRRPEKPHRKNGGQSLYARCIYRNHNSRQKYRCQVIIMSHGTGYSQGMKKTDMAIPLDPSPGSRRNTISISNNSIRASGEESNSKFKDVESDSYSSDDSAYWESMPEDRELLRNAGRHGLQPAGDQQGDAGTQLRERERREQGNKQRRPPKGRRKSIKQTKAPQRQAAQCRRERAEHPACRRPTPTPAAGSSGPEASRQKEE